MEVERVVLLNADYTFLNIVSWKKAITLLVKEKVEVLKYSEKVINTCDQSLQLPKILKMVYIIKQIWKNTVPFTKKNVFIRDGHRCVYCDSPRELTLDHVIPSSKGGKTTFENCVACCRTCNVKKKRDRTPEEAGMPLRKRPYRPTIVQFLKKKMEKYKIDELINELFEK